MAAHDVVEVEQPVRDYMIGADVLVAGGHAEREEAAAALAAARAWVQEHAARISDPEMRASFEAMPMNARALREKGVCFSFLGKYL